MISNPESVSEELKQLYMSHVSQPTNTKATEEYENELRSFVATIEKFIIEEINGNPGLFKAIKEGDADYYMKKGDAKLYFKRVIIVDVETAPIETLETYFSYVSISFHEDEHDNMVIYDETLSPFIKCIIDKLKLSTTYNNISELRETKDNPTDESDDAYKLISLVKLLLGQVDYLNETISELKEKLLEHERTITILTNHQPYTCIRQTLDEPVHRMPGNISEQLTATTSTQPIRTSSTASTTSNPIHANNETSNIEEGLDVPMTPELIQATDALLSACISHERNSNQLIVYSQSIKAVASAKNIVAIISHRLKSTGWVYSTALPGRGYNTSQTGVSWYGFTTEIDKFDFDKRLIQIPSLNIESISNTSKTFYEALFKTYTDYWNELSYTSMNESERLQLITKLRKEKAAMQASIKSNGLTRIRGDEQLCKTIKPIRDEYMKNKIELIGTTLSKLNR